MGTNAWSESREPTDFRSRKYRSVLVNVTNVCKS
jgi:hypothetical protein